MNIGVQWVKPTKHNHKRNYVEIFLNVDSCNKRILFLIRQWYKEKRSYTIAPVAFEYCYTKNTFKMKENVFVVVIIVAFSNTFETSSNRISSANPSLYSTLFSYL